MVNVAKTTVRVLGDLKVGIVMYKVNSPHPHKNSAKPAFGTGAITSNDCKIIITTSANQKLPKAVKAVAPNVFPNLTSQLPAYIWHNPPKKKPRGSIIPRFSLEIN